MRLKQTGGFTHAYASQSSNHQSLRRTRFCLLPTPPQAQQGLFRRFLAPTLCIKLQNLQKSSPSAEKHQRNSISDLVELSGALDSRLFSTGTSLLSLILKLVPPRHEAAMDFQLRLNETFCCTLHWSQDLCFSVDSWKTSAARSPEMFHPMVMNIHFCHMILVTFLFRLKPNSLQDAVVQLPFRCSQHCDRKCFFNGLRDLLLLELLSPIFSLRDFEEKVDILVLTLAGCQLSHIIFAKN